VDNLKKYFFATALAGILYLGTVQISFANLVTNGTFTSFTTAPPNPPDYGAGLDVAAGNTPGNPTYTTGAALTDWTSTGYNFVFVGGNVDGQTIVGSDGDFSLWGPASGSNNSLGAPNSGNVIAADGAYEIGPIYQSINVVKNVVYAVTFVWAGAQQSGYTDATTEAWYVDLGAAGLTNAQIEAGGKETPVVNNVSEGFTGWMTETFDFTATTTGAEDLYFLAYGTPDGEPPFSLLADVSMVAVPEPIASSFWTLFFGMLIMFGNRAWQRYQKRPSTITA